MGRHNGGVIGPFVQTSPSAASGVWTVNDAAARLSRGGYFDGWAGSADANFSSVVFLTHFDPYPGLNGVYNVVNSTQGVECSASGYPIYGTSKFGNYGFKCGLIHQGITGVGFGTGDWTIEGWAYITSTAIAQCFADMRPPSTNGIYPTIYGNSSDFVFLQNSVDRITGTGVLVANVWKHWAAARSGTSTKLYYDGNQVGSTYSDSNNYIGNDIWFGNSAFTNLPMTGGYLDELRVTKGVARYTGATYTVPTAPFPDR